jgi:hypothetical protein
VRGPGVVQAVPDDDDDEEELLATMTPIQRLRHQEHQVILTLIFVHIMA